ncbi:MAG: cytochrome c [Burkholderiales bacterium]|nr:cytochrome c [Burkholderiales bacterium]
MNLLLARASGPLFFIALLSCAELASAQDSARGRALYVANCARCHADPPGSGFIDPRVRTPDEIRGALNRVSPMGFLQSVITAQDERDLAAYFVESLGPPTNRPDYNVGDFWWDQKNGGSSINLRQFSGRNQLAGIWYTYDASGNPVWFLFNGGSWSGPSIYTAPLFRGRGSPFTAAEVDPSRYGLTEVGLVALVFSNRDNVDLTFTVSGQRTLAKMVRFAFPN